MDKKKKGRKRRKHAFYSWKLTLALLVVTIGIVMVLWALFINGPELMYQQQLEQTVAKIQEQVPGIEQLLRCDFNYVTWQGCTADTLYWFDGNGEIITTRDLNTLNYNGARETAQESYGLTPVTVELAFGYNRPVYEITGDSFVLMLDYDTLDWVYERSL